MVGLALYMQENVCIKWQSGSVWGGGGGGGGVTIQIELLITQYNRLSFLSRLNESV